MSHYFNSSQQILKRGMALIRCKFSSLSKSESLLQQVLAKIAYKNVIYITIHQRRSPYNLCNFEYICYSSPHSTIRHGSFGRLLSPVCIFSIFRTTNRDSPRTLCTKAQKKKKQLFLNCSIKLNLLIKKK